MKTRLLIAAVVSLAALSPVTVSADPPTSVVINVRPIPFPHGDCRPFQCGTWDLTSAAIDDSGNYRSIEAAVAPPDRNPFSPGPLFETFLLTRASGDGSLTVRAEERLVGTIPNQNQTGVWQIESGTGIYADASGHGDVSRTISCCPFTLTLTLSGVIGKVGLG